MSYTIVTDFAGQVGVAPRLVRIASTDNLATITTAGYLNNSSNNSVAQILPTDFIFVTYLSSGAVVNELFTPSFSGGVITLSSYGSAVATPTIANHIIVSTNTAGALANLTGTAINDGSIQAGRNTIAGTFISFPSTTTSGSLILAAVANSGNFNVTISNSSHAQSTVYSLGDIGASTGGIPVATSAIRIKSVAGAAAAGGNAAQSFTDAFCTSASNVIGNWNTQANAVSVLKIVPGNGSFVVTSSGDAGVGTFNYLITK